MSISNLSSPKSRETFQPPIIEEDFSYVEAFATGGYSYAPDDPLTEKIRVIATWFFSIITCGLFPAVAFFACFLRDLLDALAPPQALKGLNDSPEEDAAALANMDAIFDTSSDESEEEITPSPKGDHPVTTTSLRIENLIATRREDSPNSLGEEFTEIVHEDLLLEEADIQPVRQKPKAPDFFVGLDPFMPTIRVIMETLAIKPGSQVAGLATVKGKVEPLPPLTYLTAILSERELVDHFGALQRRTSVKVILLTLNLFAKFHEGIDAKRQAMGESMWQKQIAGFEKFCDVEPGTFSKYKNTEDFINKVIEMREQLHRTILERKLEREEG